MAEALKIGYCGVCNTVEILKKIDRRMVITPEYAEFSFVLSNGMIYRHGVCKKCINELDEAKVKVLIERIKETWGQEMVGWANDGQFDRMRSLKLKVYDIDEKKALKKYKEIRKKEIKERMGKNGS